jgi:hypothetical protein
MGDDSASYVELAHYSSTFTGFPDNSSLNATGDGGLNILASHASGDIKFLAGGAASERFRITSEGALILAEISSTPTAPTASTQWQIYAKGDFFVIRFNDAGTNRYIYLNGTLTSGTWTASTSAP